jgi:hypothetical protein
MNKRLLVAVPAGAALAAVSIVAVAAFTSRGAGLPTVHAATMKSATAPTVAVAARNVTATWTQGTMSNNVAVAGYVVKRYPAAGGIAVTVGSGCSGSVAALTCTENAVTPGSWRYTVTAAQGVWRGTESGLSSTVTVGSPTLSLSSSSVAPAHPLTAIVTNFADGDSVSFHLGSAAGTVIGTSVTASSAAGTHGSASGTVTIPAGTTSGNYTVYAVGTSPDQATAGVLVDATAPTVSASAIALTTSATASGYISQGSQYYVYASVADLGGSGLASVTANVGNVTSGSTAVTLFSGTYAVGATNYNYRSAPLAAGSSLTEGAKSYTVSATDGVGNSSGAVAGSVTVDSTAPTGVASVIAPTSGGTAGTIAPGSQYYVYANATDAASGVASVIANVNTITAGQTAVALSSTGGPFTANSVSYTYRSGAVTADSSLSSGSKSYTLSATDAVGNGPTSVTPSVTVSSTAPVITTVALAHTTNVTQQGTLANAATYYVYANVTDTGGPGVGTVTANVSSITTGSTSVALTTTGGPFTAFSTTYNYRSASLTAGTLSGIVNYTVNAKDTSLVAATAVVGSVTADNTAPTIVSVSTTDHSGTVEAGDTVTVTFSEAIDPGTVNQTAGATTASFTQNANGNVRLSISGLMASSDTGVAKGGGWLANGKQLISYPGTLALSNSNQTVTFTISGACTAGCADSLAGAAGALIYTPDSALNDYAGNAVSGTKTTASAKAF